MRLVITKKVVHRYGPLFIEASYNTAWTGEGVSFRAFNVGTDDGHYTDFVWSFDDPGTTYKNHDPECPLPNDRNLAYGPIVGHTWLTPGVKTVTCTQRTPLGQMIAATFEVTVTEPTEAEFDRILYVSFADNFTGAPAAAGKIEHISNADDLRDRITSNTWILFRRGETFDVQRADGSERHGLSLGVGLNLWTEWGEGDPAVYQISRATADGVSHDGSMIRTGAAESGAMRFSIQGMKFSGGYDPLANPEAEIKGSFNPALQRTRFTIQDAGTDFRFSAWQTEYDGLIDAGADIRLSGANIYMGDFLITNWQDYGWGHFGVSQTRFFDGGIIRQKEGVLSQDGKQEGVDVTDPSHGCVRAGPPIKWHGAYLTSYSTGGGWFSNIGYGRTEQPCDRLNWGNEDNTDKRVAYTGCAFEGGQDVCVYGKTNSDDVLPSVGRGIYQMCRFYGTEWTVAFITIAQGGLVVRNCIGIMPDVENVFGGFSRFINMATRHPNTSLEAYQAPVVAESNTMVSLQSLANNDDAMVFMNMPTEASITERNNLLVGPHRPNELPDWSPLGANYAPITGSAAIGAAEGAPYRDLTGAVRPVPGAVGAQELAP